MEYQEFEKRKNELEEECEITFGTTSDCIPCQR
jgi:hypothetical protein